MKDQVRKYPIVNACISGILAGGVYSFGFPSLLLPFFLALFFYSTIDKKHPKTLKQIALGTTVFLWSYYFIVLIWFLDTDVTLLAGLSGEYAKPLLGLCLIIMATMWTTVSMPLALVIYKLRNKLIVPGLLPLIILASAWVIMEWCRSIAFSIFLYAPGASMGDYWNFGSLGLGLISSPLGYLAQYLGMYGLGMVVIVMAMTIVWALNSHIKPLLITIPCVIIVALGGYVINIHKNNESKVSASVLQREGKLDDLSSGFTDIKYLSDTPKSLIVLTEYSKIHATGSEKYAQKFILNRLNNDGVTIDVVADFTKAGVRFNTLEARSKNGGVLDTQTKQLLIPTGEYLPGILQIFYKLTGQDDINQNFAATRQLYRGQPPRVVTTGLLSIAPVACSGILGRNIYRDLVNDGGEVLTNSASLLIFSGSKAYFRQSLQMARFHAIANKRTYIQASMGAPAFVISNSGSFIVKPEDTKTAFIDFEFAPQSAKTAYTSLGEWPLLFAAIVTIGFSIKLGWAYIRSRRNS